MSDLTAAGDQLQSTASRLSEFVLGLSAAPYEVRMAALEAQSAVDLWTVARVALPEHPGGLVTQHGEARANPEKQVGFGPLEGVGG